MSERRSRNYCFTLNNYTEQDVNIFNEMKEGGELRYIVAGMEEGELEHTPHLQGFIMFTNAKTFKAALKWFSQQLGHHNTSIRPADGTAHEAATYCKKDGNYVEIGTPPAVSFTEKKKTAFERATNNLQLVRENRIRQGLIEDPVWFISNINRIPALMRYLHPEPVALANPVLMWISGPSGVGKSTFARSLLAKLGLGCYPKNHNKWWDGYDGRAGVIWDEWNPGHSEFFTDLLKIWSDYMPCNVEVKNGSMLVRPPAFIITSNYTLDECFASRSEVDREAIRRRTMGRIIEPFSRERIEYYMLTTFD